MPLSAGTRLGVYEIVEPLGAGGMGEVYRARDPRMGREVAIKIAAEQFSERFSREVHAVAALNHPNICHLYDVGPNYLVMELVDGPTLADRIQQGPIPPDEALAIAKQIADALEAAHEKGIVHRDLKPANVKIKPDGTVKVLDFGLAKMADPPEASGARPEQSPTLTLDAATRVGVILGTAAYMSPEQARGKPVDKRADIWAFGVVLYEMLTGQRLFEGETVSDTLIEVATKEPDLSRIPSTPGKNVQRLLRRCLARDPRKRLRDIGEAWFLSEDTGDPVPAPIAPQREAWRWVVALAVLIALISASLALALGVFRERAPERQVLRYTLPSPEGLSIQRFAVSPDGNYLVMLASDGKLWLRSLKALEARPLPGTEGANLPFWSPDSRYIAFYANGRLKKIAAAGGPPQTICDALGSQGGTWSRDGVILFRDASGLNRVPAAGGPAVRIPGDAGAFFPTFLPDGRRFLYADFGKDAGIYLGSLGSNQTRRVLADASKPEYFDGHIIFVRDQTLMAQPVDPKTMEPKGDLFPVVERVSFTPPGDYHYSVSNNGLLVYWTGGTGTGRQHFWLDRTGKELAAVGRPVASRNSFALSPDDKRLLLERLAGINSDLWMFDLEHGTESRFTFDASSNVHPVWSPDGSKVAFASSRSGNFNLYERASNGTGQDELLYESKNSNRPLDWSHDGRFLIFLTSDAKTLYDIWALPMTGGKSNKSKPIPLLTSEFVETQGQLSPDTRWLAYTSDESGRSEVYVVPFAPGSSKSSAGKWQISTAGGAQPRWRGDGRELFFTAPDRKLMSVDVRTAGDAFERGLPQPLFDSPSDARNPVNWDYVPSADGKRFLFAVQVGGRGEQIPLTVVVNWLYAVKQ